MKWRGGYRATSHPSTHFRPCVGVAPVAPLLCPKVQSGPPILMIFLFMAHENLMKYPSIINIKIIFFHIPSSLLVSCFERILDVPMYIKIHVILRTDFD